MNQLKITVYNDRKEKDQSWEATATFDYIWDNSWKGCGGETSMTAFGKTEAEARQNLKEELFTHQSAFVKALAEASI